MQTPEFSSFSSHRELEEAWRVEVESAQKRYNTATAEYRRILQEQPGGRAPDGDNLLARARRHESEALAEYARVLGEYTLALKSLAESASSEGGSDGKTAASSENAGG